MEKYGDTKRQGEYTIVTNDTYGKIQIFKKYM